MSHPEHDQPTRRAGEPEAQSPLPPDLAAFLADQPLAVLLQSTDHGTAFVLKASAADIDSLRGRIPIAVRHELYAHPAAPVIRTVLTFYDQPDRPLRVESFTNVADPDQRADFAALAGQQQALILCYDDTLQHRLTKAVTLSQPDQAAAVVDQADAFLATIAPNQVDFMRAKRDVMEGTSL